MRVLHYIYFFTVMAIFRTLNIRTAVFFKRLLGIISPPTIIPYLGYGHQNRIYLKGQVLEDRPDFNADETDKKSKNFKTMLSRYLSTPLPEIKVNIVLRGEQYTIHCDELGYFSKWITSPSTFESGHHEVTYSICDVKGTDICTSVGEFVIYNEAPDFGVISDIDDTILVSHATQLLRKIRLIMTKNAKTRLPFEGVAEFYQEMSQHQKNPIFYVSSSEWNLYDFLVDFFAVRQIPKGPFLLQEFKSGIKDLLFTGGGSHQHKLQKIRRLMDLYPDMDFFLIGDSGQKDPLIYHKALLEFHERIKAVYIRKIKKKDDFDQTIKADFEKYKVPLLLIKNTREAEIHARENGWID